MHKWLFGDSELFNMQNSMQSNQSFTSLKLYLYPSACNKLDVVTKQRDEATFSDKASLRKVAVTGAQPLCERRCFESYPCFESSRNISFVGVTIDIPEKLADDI